MRFDPTPVEGAWVIVPEPHGDDRGLFARTWCARTFRDQGLVTDLSQCSVSFNRRAGTLRGMHYQAAPHEEVKLVRCVRGAIWDVVLDLRPESATYLRYAAEVLTQENRLAMYVPAGCAHGFLTLEDGAEVFYQISTEYHAPAQRGVRWDDPAFAIPWPAPPVVMAERDRGYPDYRRAT